jgi:hypothetical protein
VKEINTNEQKVKKRGVKTRGKVDKPENHYGDSKWGKIGKMREKEEGGKSRGG